MTFKFHYARVVVSCRLHSTTASPQRPVAAVSSPQQHPSNAPLDKDGSTSASTSLKARAKAISGQSPARVGQAASKLPSFSSTSRADAAAGIQAGKPAGPMSPTSAFAAMAGSAFSSATTTPRSGHASSARGTESTDDADDNRSHIPRAAFTGPSTHASPTHAAVHDAGRTQDNVRVGLFTATAAARDSSRAGLVRQRSSSEPRNRSSQSLSPRSRDPEGQQHASQAMETANSSRQQVQHPNSSAWERSSSAAEGNKQHEPTRRKSLTKSVSFSLPSDYKGSPSPTAVPKVLHRSISDKSSTGTEGLGSGAPSRSASAASAMVLGNTHPSTRMPDPTGPETDNEGVDSSAVASSSSNPFFGWEDSVRTRRSQFASTTSFRGTTTGMTPTEVHSVDRQILLQQHYQPAEQPRSFESDVSAADEPRPSARSSSSAEEGGVSERLQALQGLEADLQSDKSAMSARLQAMSRCAAMRYGCMLTSRYSFACHHTSHLFCGRLCQLLVCTLPWLEQSMTVATTLGSH